MAQKERAYKRARRASAHSFTREERMNRLDEEWITSTDDVFTFRVESITSIDDPFTSDDDIFRLRT